jgi:hypothetical protein
MDHRINNGDPSTFTEKSKSLALRIHIRLRVEMIRSPSDRQLPIQDLKVASLSDSGTEAYPPTSEPPPLADSR